MEDEVNEQTGLTSEKLRQVSTEEVFSLGLMCYIWKPTDSKPDCLLRTAMSDSPSHRTVVRNMEHITHSHKNQAMQPTQ